MHLMKSLLTLNPFSFFSLESVEWLEAFLRNQNLPMVIVSHDREFLDQVCTKIVDAEGGICTEYNGNYSRFLQLKKGAFVMKTTVASPPEIHNF